MDPVHAVLSGLRLAELQLANMRSLLQHADSQKWSRVRKDKKTSAATVCASRPPRGKPRAPVYIC